MELPWIKQSYFGYIFESTESRVLKRYLNTHVHGNIIHLVKQSRAVVLPLYFQWQPRSTNQKPSFKGGEELWGLVPEECCFLWLRLWASPFWAHHGQSHLKTHCIRFSQPVSTSNWRRLWFWPQWGPRRKDTSKPVIRTTVSSTLAVRVHTMGDSLCLHISTTAALLSARRQVTGVTAAPLLITH